METNMRRMEEMQDGTSKLLSRVMDELDEERARSATLLRNILPEPIIERLSAGEQTIADRYDDVAVLFSDIVGFTALSSDVDPHVLVAELNMMFSRFDGLCERCGVEKIKTIGDAYLAVGGLPGTNIDHVAAVAELGLGMLEAVRETSEETARSWHIRIGINSGPAVAGVIGTHKFVYDVWGDTVNVASRLETSADPDTIHVSEPVASALGSGYEVRLRGVTELKGKGAVSTYVLAGRRA
jgi:class 3 adenylate cyclase